MLNDETPEPPAPEPTIAEPPAQDEPLFIVMDTAKGPMPETPEDYENVMNPLTPGEEPASEEPPTEPQT